MAPELKELSRAVDRMSRLLKIACVISVVTAIIGSYLWFKFVIWPMQAIRG